MGLGNDEPRYRNEQQRRVGKQVIGQQFALRPLAMTAKPQCDHRDGERVFEQQVGLVVREGTGIEGRAPVEGAGEKGHGPGQGVRLASEITPRQEEYDRQRSTADHQREEDIRKR